MRAPEGGFFSALDADSEGVEGKFYVWTLEELREVAGEEARHAGSARPRAATSRAANILTRGEGEPEELDEWRRKLYEVRAKRVWPGLDDKRLTSWNALMISALADAGAVLGRADFVDAARGCADFVLRELRDDDGRLLRTFKDGQAKLNAYLEDHAYLLEALLTLYEATFEPRWFAEARAAGRHDDRALRRRGAGRLLRDLDRPRAARGAPQGPGGPPDPGRQLERRLRPAPPGRPDRRARVRAPRRVRAAAAPPESPRSTPRPSAICSRPWTSTSPPSRRWPSSATAASELERVVRGAFRPHLVLAGGEPDGVPLLEGREPVDGRAAAYVCEHFACKAPVTEPADLAALLD